MCPISLELASSNFDVSISEPQIRSLAFPISSILKQHALFADTIATPPYAYIYWIWRPIGADFSTVQNAELSMEIGCAIEVI